MKKEFWFYLLVSALSTFLILFIFSIFKIDTNIPLNYHGDAVQPYNFAKNIIDSGWWIKSSKLGAPLGQNLIDYPLSDGLHFSIMKILAMAGLNYIQVVNIFYILTFPLTSLIAYYVLRKFNVTTWLATALSIVYTFIPYHLYRGVDHLLISSYYTVPLGVLVAYYFASNFLPKKLYLALLGVIMASSGAYYMYFTAMLVFVGAVYGYLKSKNKKVITSFLLFGLVMGITFLVNISPNLVYQYKYGRNLNTTARFPNESEQFGLKISRLLIPIEDHNIPIFNKAAKRYVIYGPEGSYNEVQFSALGLVASIGFIYLIASALFDFNTESNTKILSVFVLSSILLGTVSGFSSLLSYFVNPVFRSVNRISIMIAFMSLVGLANLLQTLSSKMNKNKVKLPSFLFLLIILIALYDQVSKGTMRNFRNNSQYYSAMTTFIEKIEHALGKGALVYTLPFGEYPEGGEKSLVGFALISNSLSWSTGAGKWRQSSYWQYENTKLDTESFLRSIIERGFTGLMLKNDNATLEINSNLQNILGIPDLAYSDSFYFYDLQEYKNIKNISEITPDLEYYISGGCVHDYSKSAGITKYWCVNNPYIVTTNNTDSVLKKTFIVNVNIPNTGESEILLDLEIPSGTSKHKVEYPSNGVFPKPYEETDWPSTLGYPNLIINNVAVY